MTPRFLAWARGVIFLGQLITAVSPFSNERILDQEIQNHKGVLNTGYIRPLHVSLMLHNNPINTIVFYHLASKKTVLDPSNLQMDDLEFESKRILP